LLHCTALLGLQAEAMTKHYKIPVLLIEFEGDKAFALQVGWWAGRLRGWPIELEESKTFAVHVNG